jgi:hypothetical protein
LSSFGILNLSVKRTELVSVLHPVRIKLGFVIVDVGYGIFRVCPKMRLKRLDSGNDRRKVKDTIVVQIGVHSAHLCA